MADAMGGVAVDRSKSAELAIEASPTGVIVVDAAGRIVLVNRELERVFGWSRDDLIGRPLEILLAGVLPYVQSASQQDAHRGDARRTGDADLTACRRDGTPIAVDVAVSPIEGSPLVLVSVVDISDRRRIAEEQRRLLADQLDFERLVADLSVQFINLPPERIQDAIGKALERIGSALNLDRCTFFKIEPDGSLRDPVSWHRDGVPPHQGPVSGTERFPWSLGQVLSGEVLCFSSIDDVPNEVDRVSYRMVGTQSAVVVPLGVKGRVVGAISFNAVRAPRTWPPEVVHRLRVVASAFGQVLARWSADDALRTALAELERLKENLQAENVQLRREVQTSMELISVFGRSPAIRRVLDQISQVAATDSTVLLLGETGTGKELFATRIHELGGRRGRAMVRVNCAAIPATLIESELFGREKGAFTGALARQIGRFELADGSTIFLDEVGDLPPEVQVKLLRVLEERRIERLGSPQSVQVDVRVVAATHRDLEQRIREGTFREDLFYRLNVFPILVPPLRERVEDIPLLTWRFVQEFSTTFGKRIDAISKESLKALQQYSWPGNIRELRNVVERAMITATGPRLTIGLPALSAAAAKRGGKLVDVEREHIRGVLERTAWRIRGAGGAAERLGLKPTTLETRMAKLGLRRPRH